MTYVDVLETAYREELESEIRYYSIVIFNTPWALASHYADSWETVTEDIRKKELKAQEE